MLFCIGAAAESEKKKATATTSAQQKAEKKVTTAPERKIVKKETENMDGKMYVSVRTASGAPLKRAIDEEMKLKDALNELLSLEGVSCVSLLCRVLFVSK
jgi:uncharacterized protein YbcC (UPF0753/DUF2309 family)